MAVIGKIQKNSYLLLIVIGLAMLAFIFTDNFKNIGGAEEPLDRGTIFGEAVNEEELSKLEDEFVTRDRQNAVYQGNEYKTQDEQNSRDQAFNELIRRQLMDKELTALGLMVGVDELNDMISGNHIHPWVSQIAMFKDNTGQYSRDSLYKFLDNMIIEPDGSDTAALRNWRLARNQWSKFEQELKDARATDKYVSLVKKGLYVNTLEAKDKYRANKEVREISFVLHKYNSITEAEVEFTDDDIKAYYDKHKNDKKYEQTVESAEINFVEFPVKYSAADIEKVRKEMEALKGAFKNTDNNAYFMATKGEDKFFSDTTAFELGDANFEMDVQKNSYKYPKSIDSIVQKSQEGDVIGPFETVGTDNSPMMVIAKVNGFEFQKRAWVRHILITANSRSEDQAKSMADSIIRVIKSKDNFTEMVEKYTEDPGSKATGGEYKWFKEGQMVPEFNDASFNGPKGKLQLVKTSYGYHIVEVLGREDRKMPRLAPVRRSIKPGVETIKEVENIAYEFISAVEELGEDSAFYKIADEKNLVYNYSKLFISSNFVNGFENTSKIKKFAFAKDADEGDISEAIYDNGVIKVAILDNSIGIGVPEYEDVKDQMRVPALKDKKAEFYIDLMAGTANLNEVAGRVAGGDVQKATVKFGTNSIPGAGGNESEIIGIIFALDAESEGSVLRPLQGENGIYVITLDKVQPVAESEDYIVDGTALLNQRNSNADGNVMRALRTKADVQDNRLKIEAQGR